MLKPKPKQAEQLPSASELLAAIHQYEQQVMDQYSKQGMTAKLARSLHDLALVSSIFGHLPPVRLSCIRSLMVPSYAGSCLNPDCKLGSTCHGNQLHKAPHKGLHLHLPHHKNEKHWSRASISFALPPELASMLRLHLSEGWKLLTAFNGAEDASHVFVDLQGKPFTSSNFSMYWNKVMTALGVPAMPPSQCRQVFVAERRSEDRVAGPNERGAAMVMGHSVHQWNKWYDLAFHARHAQQAVDAMSSWRQALLSPPAQPQQVQPTAEPQPPARRRLMKASSLIANLSPSHILPMQSDDDEIYVDI